MKVTFLNPVPHQKEKNKAASLLLNFHIIPCLSRGGQVDVLLKSCLIMDNILLFTTSTGFKMMGALNEELFYYARIP